MNFLFSTDWHLSEKNSINRTGNILEDSFAKIKEIFELAGKYDATIIHGGDVFDDECPSFGLVNRLIDTITEYKVPMHVVVGNHDVFGRNATLGDTALFTLIKSNVAPELRELTIGNTVLRGISYRNLSDHDPKLYIFGDSYKDKRKIIVTHNMLSPAESLPFPYLPVVSIKTDANLVLCGHIHTPFTVQNNQTWFVNPGCLIRRTISEKDIKPKVILFDEKSMQDIYLTKVKPGDEVFNSKKDDIDEFCKSINDVKIEPKDIVNIFSTYKDIPEDVREECLRRINKVKQGVI